MPAGTVSCLASELPELAGYSGRRRLDISITGFAPVEIDQLTADFEEDPSDPADTLDPAWRRPSLSKPGDFWHLGHHRLLCGMRASDDLRV